MAKTFASDTAMQVTTDAVQVLCGAGCMTDHPGERMMRHAKLTQIYTGTNQITRMVTGRALLRGRAAPGPGLPPTATSASPGAGPCAPPCGRRA
jgi:alkylation response protein AidB-like acyl-CoA dehydrogenase